MTYGITLYWGLIEDRVAKDIWACQSGEGVGWHKRCSAFSEADLGWPRVGPL